ncbi:hypothetical protein AU467_25700 [Mesorhizobium loti]|uniref:Uncharacterized protein n=1 Tax=Rhizobium loti TaxID=381 RepID=A0A101KRE1_RHILI|nr:hypothetical protein AU467_25700 [Mesorhizobium loti]
MLARWLKLVPALFRHDPLFRYASIAAVLALILFAVSIGQHVVGAVAVTGAGKTGPAATVPEGSERRGRADMTGGAATARPPAPGSPGAPMATTDTAPIAPGHTLDHLRVEPASPDKFGTMP